MTTDGNVKRDPRLVELSRDHYRALLLAAALRKSGQSVALAEQAQADLVAQFPADIEPHFRIEEETLLAGLRALAGDALPLVERAERDHAALRAGAAQVARGEAVNLVALGQLLHDHVRFEERELFQFCQAHLPDDVLQRVLQSTRERSAQPAEE